MNFPQLQTIFDELVKDKKNPESIESVCQKVAREIIRIKKSPKKVQEDF